MNARIIYACILTIEDNPVKLVKIGSKKGYVDPLKKFIEGIIDNKNFNHVEANKEQSYNLGPYIYSYLYCSLTNRLCIAISSTNQSNGHMRHIYNFLKEFNVIYTLNKDTIEYERLLLKYNQSNEQLDPLIQIQSHLDETKDVLHQNIDAMFNRGESLIDLEKGSEELELNAHILEKKSHTVKKIVWWNRLKFRVCACSTCITLIIIITIILIILLCVFLKVIK